MRIVNGWLDAATEIDYGNKSMSRNGWAPRIIVLHGTAGGNSARDTAAWFRDSDVESSAHFIIDRSGEIVQGISCEVAAWANGPTTAGHASFLPDSESVNGNWYTISIEHMKPHDDNSDQLTDAQKRASFQLIKALCDAYKIPGKAATSVNGGGLVGHSAFDPINRSRCPGPYPWDELYKYLNSGGQPEMSTVQLGKGIGAHFKDAGNGVWKCDNGYNLGGRIRQYWAFYEGVFGLPKSNEIGMSKSPATLQMFERVILVYDPNNAFDNPPRQPGTNSPEGVYLMHIDQGDGQARIAKPLVDALNKTIADKQAQIDTLQHQLSTTENAEKEDLLNQVASLTTQNKALAGVLSQIQALAAQPVSK